VSTIIKATDRNSATQAVAFNFDDMTSQADRYLDKVRAEAAQIVARARQQAQHEAAAIRGKAEAEGRLAGRAAIEEMVRSSLGQQLATLLPALEQAVAEIRHAKQAWLTHWEKSAVHVAAAIARRLVRRELSLSPEIAMELIREALELAAGSSHVRLHLNPADRDALQPQIEALLQELAGLGSPEVVADPQVARGGCRVETRFGTIDQQLETQLARIEEELT
jgi:flagellar assembly protein FliH